WRAVSEDRERQGEFLDLMDLAGLVQGTPYQVADTLLSAIVHAETLDRVTWLTRQGKVIAAIAPADYVSERTEPDEDISAKLDKILGIIRGGELCARCGQVAVGYAGGEDNERLCCSGDRNCYSLYLYERMGQRLGKELYDDLERERESRP